MRKLLIAGLLTRVGYLALCARSGLAKNFRSSSSSARRARRSRRLSRYDRFKEPKFCRSAAEVLLVSEADLPGLAKLHRHLDALANLQISSTQLRLIINRWHRHDEQALERVQSGMKIPVFARLPNNFKQVSEATVRGDSLKKNGDPLSAEFQRMAARLAGLALNKQTKKSRLGHLFSL